MEFLGTHGMFHVAKRVLILQLEIEDILKTLQQQMAVDVSATYRTMCQVTPSKLHEKNYSEAQRVMQSTIDNGSGLVVDAKK